MKIVIFSRNKELAGYVTSLISKYWGNRGLAVFADLYFRSALEASVGAAHMLSGIVEEEIPIDSFSDAVIEWGYSKKGPDFWHNLFKKRTDDILADWRQKNLPHIFIAHGVTRPDDAAFFKDYLRVRIGEMGAVLPLSSHLVFSEVENPEAIAATISKQCSDKISGAFNEENKEDQGTTSQ